MDEVAEPSRLHGWGRRVRSRPMQAQTAREVFGFVVGPAR
jgi:hypothetical protein